MPVFRSFAAVAALIVMPTTAFAPSATGRCRRASTGHDVRVLQSWLDKMGFHTGIDGAFGRNTRWNLRRFEQAKGLRVNGVLTPLRRARDARRDVGALLLRTATASRRRIRRRDRAGREGDDVVRRPSRRRALGRSDRGPGSDRGGEQDRRQAVQVRRRPRQLGGLGLRLLGHRLLRAARRRPAEAADVVGRLRRLGRRAARAAGSPSTTTAATPTRSSPASGSTPRAAAAGARAGTPTCAPAPATTCATGAGFEPAPGAVGSAPRIPARD